MTLPTSMPKIMGILNATPDSHYIDSRNDNLQSAINYGLDLWRQGADLIDEVAVWERFTGVALGDRAVKGAKP